MPCNFVPNDVFRGQFYKSKTDEWFGKFVFILICEYMVLPPRLLVTVTSCSTCFLPSEFLPRAPTQ